MTNINVANILQQIGQIPGAPQNAGLVSAGQNTPGIADVFQLLLAQFAARQTPLPTGQVGAEVQNGKTPGLTAFLQTASQTVQHTPNPDAPEDTDPLAHLQAIFAQLIQSKHPEESLDALTATEKGLATALGQLQANISKLGAQGLNQNGLILAALPQIQDNQNKIIPANFEFDGDAFQKLATLFSQIEPGSNGNVTITLPENGEQVTFPKETVLDAVEKLQILLQKVAAETDGKTSNALQNSLLVQIDDLIRQLSGETSPQDKAQLTASNLLNTQITGATQTSTTPDTIQKTASDHLDIQILKKQTQLAAPKNDASEQTVEGDTTPLSANGKNVKHEIPRAEYEWRSSALSKTNTPSQGQNHAAQVHQAITQAKAEGRAPGQALAAIAQQDNPAVKAVAGSETGGQSFDLDGSDPFFRADGSHVRLTGDIGRSGQSFTQHMVQSRAATSLATQQISMHLTRGAADQVDSMIIRLQPAELGRVRIEMKFGEDGTVKAHLLVDKPETLQLLQKDSSALEKALQDAGLKTSQDSLSFDLRHHDGNKWQDAQNDKGYGNAQDGAFGEEFNTNENAVIAHMAMGHSGSISRDHVNIMV